MVLRNELVYKTFYGHLFLKIFEHDVRKLEYFKNADEALDCRNHSTKYSIINRAHKVYIKPSNSYEFIFESKINGLYYFRQQYFPHMCTENSGMSAPGFQEIMPNSMYTDNIVPFRGLCRRTLLYKPNQHFTYIDGNPHSQNWHYAIGMYEASKYSAIPIGADGENTRYEREYIRLWARIDKKYYLETKEILYIQIQCVAFEIFVFISSDC